MDAYSEVISFPESLLHVVNLTDIMNYDYNEVKSPVLGTSVIHLQYSIVFHNDIRYVQFSSTFL